MFGTKLLYVHTILVILVSDSLLSSYELFAELFSFKIGVSKFLINKWSPPSKFSCSTKTLICCFIGGILFYLNHH